MCKNACGNSASVSLQRAMRSRLSHSLLFSSRTRRTHDSTLVPLYRVLYCYNCTASTALFSTVLWYSSPLLPLYCYHSSSTVPFSSPVFASEGRTGTLCYSTPPTTGGQYLLKSLSQKIQVKSLFEGTLKRPEMGLSCNYTPIISSLLLIYL